MDEIKVSVILTVYNTSEYLEQCLRSVMNQTLKEIEIICVDDGSTDGSEKILKQLQSEDSRIIVLHQENAGAGAARNYGLSHAKGKYLSILDSDDFFDIDMLELAYNAAEKYAAQIVVFRSNQYITETSEYKPMTWTLRNEDLPPYMPFSRRQITNNVFTTFVGWAWDKLFLRSFVEEHKLKFQEIRTTNDMYFTFSAIALAERIAVVKEILVHQRRDAKSSLSKTREKSWQCFYEALTALRERLQLEGLFGEMERDYVNYAVHSVLWNINTLAEPTKSVLIDKMRTEWSSALGIEGKPEEYFYRPDEYIQYMQTVYGAEFTARKHLPRKVTSILRFIHEI